MAPRLKMIRALSRAAFTVGRRRLRRRGPAASPVRREIFVEFLRERTLMAENMDAAEVRRREAATPLASEISEQLDYEERRVGGVAAEVITPKVAATGPTLLFLHGGGYNVCSPATHRGLTSRLALAIGGPCVALNYRLAPEHPYPAAVDDALAAYRSLLKDGDPRSLVVAGDSAGGGLTLALLLALRRAGDPLPASAALLSPWVDLTCSHASIDDNEPTDYVTRRILEVYSAGYVGDGDRRLPGISPLFADLSGLPPLLIQIGGVETLLDEGRELAEKARASGVEVELEVFEGMFHVFQAMAPMVPQAELAIEKIGAFFRS